MGLFAVITLLLSLATFASSSYANPDEPHTASDTESTEEHLTHQRNAYIKALKALEKGSQWEYKRYKQQLADYPLYPYLEYVDLSIMIRHRPYDRIDQFLTVYDGTSIANRFRARWLKELKRRKRGQDFIKYYRQEVANTELTCYYHYARHETGDQQIKADALEQALTLWTVGQSQPALCDPLFDKLIAAELITSERAWQRFSLAIENRKTSLARYLQRFIKQEPYVSYARHALLAANNPLQIGKYQNYSDQSPEMLRVIKSSLMRLAASNSKRSLNYWAHYQQTHPFSVSSQTEVTERIIKALYQQQHQSAADEYLASSLAIVEPPLIEWRIRKAMQEADWQGTLQWIERLPNEYRKEERWQYWHARLSEQLHQQDPTATYQNLAKRRNFYGFLASDQLNIPYVMEEQPLPVGQELVEAVVNYPAIQRAKELIYHGDKLNARREWRDAGEHFSEAEWQAAAVVAQDWQWYSQSIWSMIRASNWNTLELRFPLHHFGAIRSHSEALDMEPNLMMALARQESALAEDAISPVGARGMMQLMPKTAQQTAQKYNIRYSGSSELLQPEKNIQLGTRYYREMLDRFSSNRILATAAYNAGPHRVQQWLKKSDSQLPFDVWIETIPFRETRNYVQNVLAFSAIYAYRRDINNYKILTHQERKQLL